jgi:hypothetical protein
MKVVRFVAVTILVPAAVFVTLPLLYIVIGNTIATLSGR